MVAYANSNGSEPKTEWESIQLMGMPLAKVGHDWVIERVREDIRVGRGGWLVTANLDIMAHFTHDAAAREAYLDADLRVADGMPLVWAAWLQGSPLPGRVTGSGLSETLLLTAAACGWKVALVGGSPGAAERVVARYGVSHPKLSIVADSAARFSVPPKPEEIEQTVNFLQQSGSQLVLLGLGSPKQEHIIRALRPHFPDGWFVGVGGTFRFLAGEVPRAPALLQKTGFEWMHRLAQEPRRLAARYLVEDLPFFFRLMAQAATSRARTRSPRV